MPPLTLKVSTRNLIYLLNFENLILFDFSMFSVDLPGQGSPSYAALPSTPSPKGPFPSAAASPLASPSSAPSPGGVTPAANLQATQQQSVLASLQSPMATISGLQNVQVHSLFIPTYQGIKENFFLNCNTI